MKTRLHDEGGQAFVFVVLLMVVLFGILGLAFDVGKKDTHDSDLQAKVDAAALAGAQLLPCGAINSDAAAQAALSTFASSAGNASDRTTPTVNVTSNRSDGTPDLITVSAGNTDARFYNNGQLPVQNSSISSTATATAGLAAATQIGQYPRPIGIIVAKAPTLADVCNGNPISLNKTNSTFLDYDTTKPPDPKTVTSEIDTWLLNGYQASPISVGAKPYGITNLNTTKSPVCDTLAELSSDEANGTVTNGAYGGKGIIVAIISSIPKNNQKTTILGWTVFHPNGPTSCSGKAGPNLALFGSKAATAAAPASPVSPGLGSSGGVTAATLFGSKASAAAPARPLAARPPSGIVPAHKNAGLAVPHLTVSIANGATSVTYGDTSSYTATIPAACQAKATYQWTITPGVGVTGTIQGSATLGTVTVSFDGTVPAAGTVKVNVMVTMSDGAATCDQGPKPAFKSVTVNPPNIHALTLTQSPGGGVNPGDTVSYTVAMDGASTCASTPGTTYAWTFSGPVTPTGATNTATVTVQFTGASPPTAVITATVTNLNCTGSPAPKSMNVNVAAANIGLNITNPGPVFAGDTGDQYGATTGACTNGVTYAWSLTNGTGSGSISGATDQSTVLLDFQKAGTVTLTVTASSPWCANSPQSKPLVINVGAAKIGAVNIQGNLNVFLGESGTFNATYGTQCDNVSDTWTISNAAGQTGQASITGPADQQSVDIGFNGVGKVTLMVTVTQPLCSDSPQTKSVIINIGAARIGTATISGDTTPAQGDTASPYSVTYTGGCSNVAYLWTLSGENPAGDATFAGSTTGSSVLVSFPTTGKTNNSTATLKVTITQAGCSDSPKPVQVNLQITPPKIGPDLDVEGETQVAQYDTWPYTYSSGGACPIAGTTWNWVLSDTTVAGFVDDSGNPLPSPQTTQGVNVYFDNAGNHTLPAKVTLTLTVTNPGCVDSPLSSHIDITIAPSLITGSFGPSGAIVDWPPGTAGAFDPNDWNTNYYGVGMVALIN